MNNLFKKQDLTEINYNFSSIRHESGHPTQAYYGFPKELKISINPSLIKRKKLNQDFWKLHRSKFSITAVFFWNFFD